MFLTGLWNTSLLCQGLPLAHWGVAKASNWKLLQVLNNDESLMPTRCLSLSWEQTLPAESSWGSTWCTCQPWCWSSWSGDLFQAKSPDTASNAYSNFPVFEHLTWNLAVLGPMWSSHSKSSLVKCPWWLGASCSVQSVPDRAVYLDEIAVAAWWNFLFGIWLVFFLPFMMFWMKVSICTKNMWAVCRW